MPETNISHILLTLYFSYLFIIFLRVLTEHRMPISLGSSVADGVGDGVAVRAVRERGARQERLHEGPAALPLQGVRAQLHRHAAARHAAADQGHGGAPVPERAVDEPHRPAAG